MGKTRNEILLKLYAVVKSKWIRCCIALVIPQPKQGLSNNSTDKQVVWPLSKKLGGRIINTIGMIIIPPKSKRNPILFNRDTLCYEFLETTINAWIIPGIPHNIVQRILIITFLMSQSVAKPTASQGIKKHKTYNKPVGTSPPRFESDAFNAFSLLLIVWFSYFKSELEAFSCTTVWLLFSVWFTGKDAWRSFVKIAIATTKIDINNFFIFFKFKLGLIYLHAKNN